jgi:hypothetical protein
MVCAARKHDEYDVTMARHVHLGISSKTGGYTTFVVNKATKQT